MKTRQKETPILPLKAYKRKELIAAGAREVRRGVWVSERRRICTDKAFKNLAEFDDPNLLHRLLGSEATAIIFGIASQRGKKYVKFGELYIQMFKRRTLNEMMMTLEKWL